jgi:hypothetical protein
LLLLGVLAATGLAACGSDSTGSSANDTMTTGEAGEVGGTAAALVGGAANSLAGFTLDDGTLTDPALAPGATLVKRNILMAALRAGARMGQGLSPSIQAAGGALDNCTPTLNNTTDTDGDGVFDDATATFTSANCTYTNDGGATVVTTGSIRVQDQGTIYGFQITFNTLRFDLSNGSQSGALVLNGSYSADVGAQLASVGQNLHITVSNSSGGSANLSEAWTLTFDPDATISGSATALPAGSFTIAGSFSATVNSRTWSLILVSTTPLVYDGSCATDPPFSSGTLEGQIAARRNHGFSVVFNGCGADPTITSLNATT